MIYEDLLSLWIAFFLWEILPSSLPFDLEISGLFKISLFFGKEFLFLSLLLYLSRNLPFLRISTILFWERIFFLLTFLLFSLDLTFFQFKKFLKPYYFSVFLALFWFLHYYLLIRVLVYRLKTGYLRIFLGLGLPFFLLILMDETLTYFELKIPGQFFLLLLLVFLFSPYLVIRVWPVCKIPSGPFRELLERFFRRLNLKFRDYLILPQLGGSLYTAGVLGVFPPFRYLFFSQGLIEIVEEEEILGVLAHEAGHLKKRHGLLLILLLLTFPLSLLNFLYLLLLLFSFLFESSQALARFLEGPYGVYFDLGLVLALLFYGIFFFRFLLAYFLRSLEREADLFALSLLGDPAPLISSLYKIGERTSQLYRKSWHHYGLWERIQYLKEASLKPGLIKGHSQRLRRNLLLWFLLNLLLLSLFTYLGANILERVLKIFLS